MYKRRAEFFRERLDGDLLAEQFFANVTEMMHETSFYAAAKKVQDREMKIVPDHALSS